MPNTSCHQTFIQVSTSPSMLLHYLGKLKHMKSALNKQKRQNRPWHYW